ncbi:MAG: HAD family hydrolase, partial [Candidatus Helarchaeales archaeon]
MTKDAVVFCFDLDGCLLNTVPFFIRITKEAFRELGIEDVDDDLLFRGLANPELDKTKRRYVDDLFKWIGREGGIKDKKTLNEFLVKVGMKYLKMTEPQYDVRLFDGVPEMLNF